MSQSVPNGKAVTVDPELGSYSPFTDHEWVKKMYALSKGTPLDAIVFDLTLAFRGIVNTHILPYLMVDQLKGFAVGMQGSYEPLALQFVQVVAGKLLARMPSLRNMQKKEMEVALKGLLDEAIVARKKADEEVQFDPLGYWQDIVSNPEFKMSLWGAQRLCYAGLYYSYEDFLLRTYLVKAPTEVGYRIQKDFGKRLKDAFGETVRDSCWCDANINVARLVRHSLAHAGGRITKALTMEKHGFDMIEEELQIEARHTRALYSLLTQRSLKLVEEVLPTLT